MCAQAPGIDPISRQDQAGAVGLRDVRYGYDGATNMGQPKDQSNPYFDFDPSKCIVCSRCVRACDEVQGTFALTIEGMGFGSKVAASQDDAFLASECVSCGACVQACPKLRHVAACRSPLLLSPWKHDAIQARQPATGNGPR